MLQKLKSAPSCLLLPKIESPQEAEYFLKNLEKTIKSCDWSNSNGQTPIPLVSFIETAIGLLNMRASFEVLKNTDLISHECVVFGR